jgi:hypothetical protein
MGHRGTTETEIRDKTLLAEACKIAGVTFTRSGERVRFTSGQLQNATLELRTGRIEGDTDDGHTPSSLGTLRQAYAEAKYNSECLRQGITIESRTIDREGNVVLMCRMD